MIRGTKRAYIYHAKCFECGKFQNVYFTVSDFGDAPIIQKCKFCSTLYWHTPEDEYYNKPLEKQLIGIVCEKCNADLYDALVPTHLHIKCCNIEFSLDDDFSNGTNLDSSPMEEVEVYLIY